MVCNLMFDGMVIVIGLYHCWELTQDSLKSCFGVGGRRRKGLGDELCAVMPCTFNCVSVSERGLCLMSTSKL